uniref:Putative secreted protein n=1 Tax=Ixodes ricinus TaxID=34613 RepID=A0A6B0TRS8_IXORI
MQAVRASLRNIVYFCITVSLILTHSQSLHLFSNADGTRAPSCFECMLFFQASNGDIHTFPSVYRGRLPR